MARKGRGRGWWGDSARHRAVARKAAKGKGVKRRSAARMAGRGANVKGIGKVTAKDAASHSVLRNMNVYTKQKRFGLKNTTGIY